MFVATKFDWLIISNPEFFPFEQCLKKYYCLQLCFSERWKKPQEIFQILKIKAHFENESAFTAVLLKISSKSLTGFSVAPPSACHVWILCVLPIISVSLFFICIISNCIEGWFFNESMSNFQIGPIDLL